jgi:hypothetical protein
VHPAYSIGPSHDVTFSPGGDRLFVVTNVGLACFDAATGERLAYSPRFGSLSALDAAGDAVLAGVQHGDYVLFDADTLAVRRRIPGDELKLGRDLRFGPGGEQFISAGGAGDLVVHTGEEVVLHEREPGRILQALTCTPDRSRFAYASFNRDAVVVRVRRWPFDANAAEDVFRADTTVWALALDGERLAIRERDRLSVLELASGRIVAERLLSVSGTPDALCWLEGGELTATDGNAVLGLEGGWRFELPYACALAASAGRLAAGSWERGTVLLI